LGLAAHGQQTYVRKHARNQLSLEIAEARIRFGLAFKVLAALLPQRRLVLGIGFGGDLTIVFIEESPSWDGNALAVVVCLL
jgi:hypothetical protein